MSTTENGWPRLYPGSSLIVPLSVAGRTFPGGVRSGPVKTVLTYLVAQYHLRVESLYYGETDKDDWGYANRPPSNHASATAVDVNATTNPQGASRSHTYAQEQVIRAILQECGGQIRWGRDFRTKPDPMHFDAKPGTTTTSMAAVAKRLLNPAWWHRELSVTSPPMQGDDVKRVQRRLGCTVDGVYGPQTRGAVRSLEARLHKKVTGRVTKSRAYFIG